MPVRYDPLKRILPRERCRIVMMIENFSTAASLSMTSFGIPLTGSMSAGFTIGFMKG